MIKNAILFFMLMLLFLPDMQAQSSTSSPLSIFGIGEIEVRDFGRTTAMGSVGIGYQSENFLNRRNPAGLSGIDTLRFILDVSAAVKFSQFRTKDFKAQTTNFNFKTLAIGVRLSKRWTSSAGLCPFSNAGYHLIESQALPAGNYSEEINYTSSGGVNKFYWSNAFELFRGFSAGVNSSFIFGNITRNEDSNGDLIRNTYNVNKLNFDFGAQYSHRFGQFTNVIVGGVYGYQSKMLIQQTQMISFGSYKEERKPDRKAYIPETYGAGFSILRNKKAAEWIFAADYQYWKWSADPFYEKKMRYTDSQIFSAGLQITPNKQRPENYIQALRFHLGASYNQSYLKVNGYQVEDISVSIGVGLPFVNNRTYERSYVNVSAIFGESGTGQRGGITERYALLSVNLSLIERWFAKRQWN